MKNVLLEILFSFLHFPYLYFLPSSLLNQGPSFQFLLAINGTTFDLYWTQIIYFNDFFILSRTCFENYNYCRVLPLIDAYIWFNFYFFTLKLFFIACCSIRNFKGQRKAWKVRLFCQPGLHHFFNCYSEKLVFNCYRFI